jgi:hypothetical protein
MMKKLIAFFSVVLLIVIAVPIGMTQEKTGALPFRPNYDREIFKKSGTSIARPDLLACRNSDAVITDGGDVQPEDVARLLHGVWVNQNGRSLHGITVETDNAFYIDMRGTTGTAIMIDRNNLNDFSMTRPYLEAGSRIRNVANPVTMTFVSCAYEFVDRYIKVSDVVPLEVLGRSTGIQFSKKATMEQAWRQIISSGYFESFDMLVQNREPGAARRRVNMATLGDGQRMAILPDGTRVDEKGIKDGDVPGAEYCLPMMVGAFFKITLTPKTEGRQYQAVDVRFDAEYRATGVNLKPGETLYGNEHGVFAKEGNALVAANRIENGKQLDDTWDSHEGGNKNELVTPSSIVAAAKGIPPGEQAHDLMGSLNFDRVIIGTPRGGNIEPKRVVPSGRKQQRQHKK